MKRTLTRSAYAGARGFTFLELILVLLIISVALALVGPTIGSSLKSGDLRRTAVQLRAAMEVMRVKAVQQGQEGVLEVAPRTKLYSCQTGTAECEIRSEEGVVW